MRLTIYWLFLSVSPFLSTAVLADNACVLGARKDAEDVAKEMHYSEGKSYIKVVAELKTADDAFKRISPDNKGVALVFRALLRDGEVTFPSQIHIAPNEAALIRTRLLQIKDLLPVLDAIIEAHDLLGGVDKDVKYRWGDNSQIGSVRESIARMVHAKGGAEARAKLVEMVEAVRTDMHNTEMARTAASLGRIQKQGARDFQERAKAIYTRFRNAEKYELRLTEEELTFLQDVIELSKIHDSPEDRAEKSMFMIEQYSGEGGNLREQRRVLNLILSTPYEKLLER